MVKVNQTNMEDLRTHAMLAEMAQCICNDEAVQSATGAVMRNALTSLEQRMGALETSTINVLKETRRFNNPAKPSRNRTLVTPKTSHRKVPSAMVTERLTSERTWVPNRDSPTSASECLVIYFKIVEPEIKNVFIVVDIIIYGNARTLENDFKKWRNWTDIKFYFHINIYSMQCTAIFLIYALLRVPVHP